MGRIKEIANRNRLVIVEDAAQAIGSAYNGKKSGSWGDVNAFSAHPLKNLNGCGDGGFITTNNETAYERIKRMRNHGLENRNKVKRFWICFPYGQPSSGNFKLQNKKLRSCYQSAKN